MALEVPEEPRDPVPLDECECHQGKSDEDCAGCPCDGNGPGIAIEPTYLAGVGDHASALRDEREGVVDEPCRRGGGQQ